MAFQSILYEDGSGLSRTASLEAPAYFRDLGLGRIVDTVTFGREEYDLKPFFYDRLGTIEMIEYRHQIMQDLEAEQTFACIKAFASGMALMRQSLTRARELYYKHQKDRWFVQSVGTYCETIRTLSKELASISLASRGLIALRDYLAAYIASDAFISLHEATDSLVVGLAKIRYSVLIKGSGLRVRDYDAELDYSAEIEDVFKKFQQGECKDYRIDFQNPLQLNHVEAQVLDFVAKLSPDLFARLDEFCLARSRYTNSVILRFDREIQFYLAYLEHMARLKQRGLNFCYPEISDSGRDVHDDDAFDLALADKLVATKQAVVCNDVQLEGKERILVVSGPNQGGKTTFARAFGQLHHLANIGLPVPGQNARLSLFDQMFVHFEREESLESLNGKLHDDLIRIHDILDHATSRSIIILNEIFSSTTLKDADFLARKVIDRIVRLDCLCVCVTFLDELASLNEKTVSMVSTVAPDNPAVRTYKVVRRLADGQAYAVSIAEKYRLTYECLSARMAF